METSLNSTVDKQSAAGRYTVAVLAAVLALLLRQALSPLLGANSPYFTVWAAVVFSAWYCGLWPSIVTTLINALGVWYWFLPPVHSFRVEDPAGRTIRDARSRTQFKRRKANSTCWQTPSQSYAGWHAATVTSSGTTHDGTSTRALHLNKWKGGAGNRCMTRKFCPPYWNDGKRRWRRDGLLRWNFPCVVLTAFSAGS